jgi:hypothetical protein
MGLNFNKKQQQYSNPFRKGPIIDEVRHIRAQIKSLECFAGHCNGDPLCAPGGVVFTDIDGNLDNNCTDFFWDNTNFRLGIGTNTPTAQLHVVHTVGPIPDAVVRIASEIGGVLMHLFYSDLFGAAVIYQNKDTGAQWKVGVPGITQNVTESFAWMDGSHVNNIRLELMRGGYHSVGSASSLRFYDGQTVVQKYFSLRAPNVLAADTDYIWPTGYPLGVGDVLASDLAGNLSWVNNGGPWTLDGANNLFTTDSTYAGGGGGNDNIIGGRISGNVAMAGAANIAIGVHNLPLLTLGSVNLAYGDNNFPILVDGVGNIGIGGACGNILTSGGTNILIGGRPGTGFPEEGDDNILIGQEVGRVNGLSVAGGPIDPESRTNILIGKEVLQKARDTYYNTAQPPIGQSYFKDLIAIGNYAGNYVNTYNTTQSIFIGNRASPIMNDIMATPFGGSPMPGIIPESVSALFCVASGTSYMTAGGATEGAGQLILYGHETRFLGGTANVEGKMLMVGGGNGGDYAASTGTYNEIPNASLHVSGFGSSATDGPNPLPTLLFPDTSYQDDHIFLATDGAGVSGGLPNPTTMFAVDHDGQIKMPNIPHHPGPVPPLGLTAGSVWHDTTTDNLKLVP